MRILDNAAGVHRLRERRDVLAQARRDPTVTQSARHVPLLRADRVGQVHDSLCVLARSIAIRGTSSPSKTRSSTTSTPSPRSRSTPSGATFATSLRSILRQDPDVIMIGEIATRRRPPSPVRRRRPATWSSPRSHSTIRSWRCRLDDIGGRAVHDLLGAVGSAGQRLAACSSATRARCRTSPSRSSARGESARRQGCRCLLSPSSESPVQVCHQCDGTGYLGRTGSSCCWSLTRGSVT